MVGGRFAWGYFLQQAWHVLRLSTSLNARDYPVTSHPLALDFTELRTRNGTKGRRRGFTSLSIKGWPACVPGGGLLIGVADAEDHGLIEMPSNNLETNG